MNEKVGNRSVENFIGAGQNLGEIRVIDEIWKILTVPLWLDTYLKVWITTPIMGFKLCTN